MSDRLLPLGFLVMGERGRFRTGNCPSVAPYRGKNVDVAQDFIGGLSQQHSFPKECQAESVNNICAVWPGKSHIYQGETLT